jgi:hypothetical protein
MPNLPLVIKRVVYDKKNRNDNWRLNQHFELRGSSTRWHCDIISIRMLMMSQSLYPHRIAYMNFGGASCYPFIIWMHFNCTITMNMENYKRVKWISRNLQSKSAQFTVFIYFNNVQSGPLNTSLTLIRTQKRHPSKVWKIELNVVGLLDRSLVTQIMHMSHQTVFLYIVPYGFRSENWFYVFFFKFHF